MFDPTKVKVMHMPSDMKDWCKEHVGANNWNYYGECKKYPYVMKFKRSEDMLAFKMRFLM